MNKKKLFGALASAAMLLNGAPLNVFAEEMVETGPSGTLTGVDSSNVALSSTNFPDDNLLTAIKNQNPTATTAAGVENLVIQGNGVKSLEGLQYLTKLKSFALIGNDNISTLDLSNNTALVGGVTDGNGNAVTDPVLGTVGYKAPLMIQNNGALTSITLPTDEDLKAAIITGNAGLDEINLASCDLLEYVDLSYNSLDTLNLSSNVYAQYLNLSHNDLYQLDATPCKQLNALNASYNKIYELKVPTAIPNALKSLNVESNKLQTFDGSGLKGLTNLNLSWNMLNSIVLPSGPFQELKLNDNHLAALNLKKVDFAADAEVKLDYQWLYANATDKAVNIKDYDANFNPDQATLANGKEFNDNSVFDIPEIPGEATKAQFTNDNTTVVVTPTGNGTYSVKVYLNNILVDPANYTLDPSSFNGKTPEEIKGMKVIVSATPEGNCLGEAVVTPTVNDGTTPVPPGPDVPETTYNLTAENTAVTYTVPSEGNEEVEAPELTAENVKVYYTEAADGTQKGIAIGVQDGDNWKNFGTTLATIQYASAGTFNVTISSANISTVGAGYAQATATPLQAVALTGVKGEKAIALTATNTRVVVGGLTAASQDLYAVQYSESGKDPWTTISSDVSIFVDSSDSPKKITVDTAGTPAAGATPEDPGEATLKFKATTNQLDLLPYYIDDSGVLGTSLATVPAVTGENLPDVESTSLRILYPATNAAVPEVNNSVNGGKAIVQIQNSEGEWVKVAETASDATGAISGATWSAGSGTGETKFSVTSIDSAAGTGTLTWNPTSAATLGDNLYAFGYKLPTADLSDPKLTGVKAEAFIPLTAQTVRVRYSLNEKGNPVIQKLQVYTGTDAADKIDYTSDTDWEDVAATPDDFASCFTLATGAKIKPAQDGAKYGTLVLNSTITLTKKAGLSALYDFPAGGITSSIPAILDSSAGETDSQPIIKTITITQDDGNTVNVPEVDVKNFVLSNLDTEKNTGDLSYAKDATEDIKKTYVIDGGSVAGVKATEATSSANSSGDDQSQQQVAEVMTEYAPATASNSYYVYSTLVQGDVPNADSMTVYVIKEDLMNRLYNPNSGEHFYTKDTHEKDVLVSLGWQYEGIGWVAPTAAQSTIPVYRLYNANAGDHHYTKDPNEKDTLVRIGWSYEGIGWYSAYDSTHGSDNAQGLDSIEVFREYNPNAKAAGAHNYTINEIENEVLTSIGWLDEGIAWWALK